MFYRNIPVFKVPATALITDVERSKKLAERIADARVRNAEHMLVPMTATELASLYRPSEKATEE